MNNLEMLSKIALLAVNTEDFDNQMNKIMQIIGKYTQVSRTYIFIDNDEGTITSNEFEWCNESIPSVMNKMQNVQYSEIPSLQKILTEEGSLYCHDIYDLPKDITNILETQDILSIIIYPLFINNKMKGFIGFDECKTHRVWSVEDLNILATISGIISNIYSNRINLNTIKELSIRDPLTNIFNRRFILDSLEKDLERKNKDNIIFSVSIIDIDFFKNINDNYGHQAGDFILKEFTKIILENIKKTDLVGRYGGEEFILVMYDSMKESSVRRITRLLEVIRKKTFFYKDQPIKFTFSGGICDVLEFEENNISIEQIISLADKRLYCAKDLGRNCIISFE
jgi:diguanylate cyclase (GGDEF)-like protein